MCSALSGLLEFSPVLLRYFISGGNFTLAELGVCEPTPPPHPNAVPYCPDLALLQRGYSLSAGSDADSDPEGPLSPERAIQLWAGQGRVKSRRSSGVSSRENSALTLTDSENDNKSDDESAYLDDEEDEDPFGDYVISKSHLTLASLRLLGPTLGFCVIVFDVLLCPLLHFSVRDLLFCL
ncbi:hypothetical protein OYC64_013421 [Pagothenia borchgrevinki]|uniref:Teneurin N-terminal domain-containing protein n=1 Tax=Pagothenia borchgrevinki TaxID=8213 RepID=A0ABD2FU15_PAGBO